MTRKLQDAVRQQKKQTKQANHQIYGLLGIPINGAKTTEVPNRNSYVYVRLRNNQSEVIQAFNNKVSPAYNLPVIVERLGGRYTVVSVDTQRYENNWTSYAPFLPRHGNTHSFDPESGGGGDTVFVHTRQFMPLLAFPSGSSGGPNVVIYPYMLKNDNGTWKYVGSTGTQDITTYNPTSATGAIMVLVYLDSVSGNPYLMVGSGTVFSNSITGTSQIAPYIPTVTNASTQIPISAIRLVTGTSQLSWDNIYDVRQFLHGVPTGTGGGGGSVTGTSDSTYLRLDTTNDPLTGQLQIIPITPDDGGAYIQTMNDAYTLDVEQLATGTATVTSPALFVYRGSQGASTPTFNNPMIEAVQINSGTTTGEFLTFNSNGVRRVSIHPSAVGTGTLAFFDSNNTLSNDGNLLLLKNNGSPKTKIAAQGNIEFGLGIVKQPGAGSIGYGLVDSGLLNIIGGGTSVPNRTVKIYDNLTVSSLTTSANYKITSLLSSLIGADSSGNFIGDEPLIPSGTYGRKDHAWEEVIPRNGWLFANETWIRTGDHTFIMSGDLTTYYRPGTKIKYNDGGLDFGVIGSSSFASGTTTTVNLIPNTDYAMASNPIGRYMSYIENPEGFPGWFTYAATVSGSGGSAGTYAEDFVVQKYETHGNTLHVVITKRITNKGSWSGDVLVLRPFTASAAGSLVIVSGGIFALGSTTIKSFLNGGNTTYFRFTLDGTLWQWSSVSTFDIICIETSYKF